MKRTETRRRKIAEDKNDENHKGKGRVANDEESSRA